LALAEALRVGSEVASIDFLVQMNRNRSDIARSAPKVFNSSEYHEASVSLQITPMRWPPQWQNPSALALLKGTNINCLLIEDENRLELVVNEARRNGIRVIKENSPPHGITVISGLWPGIRLSRSGNRDEASSGPTGEPWVNSNGWKVRLATALKPQSAVWVDARPETPSLGSYTLCLADAAACGGRWIISLEDQFATGIQSGNQEALGAWQSLGRAANFFAAHSSWSDYIGEAVVGVVSDFAGADEFLSQEVLNLLTRTWEQYRIIPKTGFSMEQLAGLRGVLYPDSDPPSAELREQMLNFVKDGGLLITRPEWGGLPGSPAEWDHPRYNCRVLGRGRIAIAKSDDADPYLLANDTVALVSHEFDLLRFWDASAVNAYLSATPDRKKGVVQIVSYASETNGRRYRSPSTVTVRVVGPYRTARLLTFDQSSQLTPLTQPVSNKVGVEIETGALELHLPRLFQYAAVELSI
jgi:hypothetical protein